MLSVWKKVWCWNLLYTQQRRSKDTIILNIHVDSEITVKNKKTKKTNNKNKQKKNNSHFSYKKCCNFKMLQQWKTQIMIRFVMAIYL